MILVEDKDGGRDPFYIFILHNSIDCSDNTLEVTANDVQPGTNEFRVVEIRDVLTN